MHLGNMTFFRFGFLLTTCCFLDNYIVELLKCPPCSTYFITIPSFVAFCKNLHGGWIIPEVSLHNNRLHFRPPYFQPLLSNPEAV